MNETAKKIGIGAIVLILVYCMLSIFFYGIVAMCFKKTVVHSVEAGPIEDTYIWEVEYWSNENGNGVELLDIRINSYLDAEQINADNPMLYSKGIQIVGNKNNSIQINGSTNMATIDIIGSVLYGFFWGFLGWDYTIDYYSNYKCYYYDTQNGVSFDSVENITPDTYFKVPIKSGETEELYLMKLKGLSPEPTRVDGSIFQTRYYENYDIKYAASKLLDISRHNNMGYDAEGTLIADFGDCFTYRKYSETTDKWLTETDTDLYKIIYENFCQFKLTTHSDGANYGSDSMFGLVANSADYEYLPEGYVDDYFVGRQVLSLNENNFSSIEGELVLNETTAKYLNKNKDKNISIVIDTEALKDKGITYKNISADFIAEYRSRLVSIKIKSLNDSGETIYTEVLV